MNSLNLTERSFFSPVLFRHTTVLCCPQSNQGETQPSDTAHFTENKKKTKKTT